MSNNEVSKYPSTNLNDNIDNIINELEGVSAVENVKILDELFPISDSHRKCLKSVGIEPINYSNIIKTAQNFNYKNNLNWILNNVLNITAMANQIEKKDEKPSFLQRLMRRK